MKKNIIIFLILIAVIFLIVFKKDEQNIFKEKYETDDVYYQIFVRSFADSDNDGIGDFNGISQNIDYFVDLGITGIYLMPIHPSPSYHGYDVLDYYDVNEDYGTLDDFENLVTVAHENEISIMIDLVINHTSDQHPWFLASRSFHNDDHEKYKDYYTWIDEDDERFGKLGAWNQNIWHSASGKYYAGYFSNQMPDLNMQNDDVIEEIRNIGEYWLNIGVDGFRLDAAMHIYGKNEVVMDDRTQENINFWKEFSIDMRLINEDVYIIGEVWTQSSVYADYFGGLDSVFNFELSDIIVNSAKTGRNDLYTYSINRLYNKFDEVRPDYIDATFLRNHDNDRIATVLNGDISRLKLAAEMQLMLPGVPFIYYGEELGMKGAKSNGPYYDETRRLPFIWADETKRTTWFNDSFNIDVEQAELQQNDEDSLYNTYKKLIDLRDSSIALKFGEFISWESDSSTLQGFFRYYSGDSYEEELIFVLHNIGKSDTAELAPDITGEIIYFSKGINNYNNVSLPKGSTLVIRLNPEDFETYLNK